MLKQLILLFNIVSFIIITALLPADIKIDTKLPTDASFVIDSTHIIDVTISKGSIFGFAKFQQNVPKGFTAHPVETADASFTFADGKIKFIWMAIPERNEITISYALIPSREAAPEGVISGKFSYLEENERKSYDIPNIPIKVISDEPVVEKIPAIASANRSVTDLGNNEYEVNVTITKEGIAGFGKLEEYLPTGAEAEVITNNKAVFSQVDDKAKFVWMSVPEGETVEIAYSVKSNVDISDALMAIEGNFSFLDEKETKTVPVMGGMPIESAALASNEGNTEEEISSSAPFIALPVGDNGETISEKMYVANDDSDTKADEVAAVAQTPTEQDQPTTKPVVEEKATVKEEVAVVEKSTPVKVTAPKKEVASKSDGDQLVAQTTKKPVTTIPNPDNGVTYKVQIAAGKKVVSEQYLRKAYSFQEPYGIENHEGWVKYTTGGFDVYKQARDKREALVTARHNFPGPFVTAYNGGERITVQEALMISNQKWYK